jgi:hypothetical protein
MVMVNYLVNAATKAVLATYLSQEGEGLVCFLGLSFSTSNWMQTATLGGRSLGFP